MHKNEGKNLDILETLLAQTDEFVEKIVSPGCRQWEVDQKMPREVFIHAADYGLTGIIVPRDCGGSDVGIIGLTSILRKIARVDMACAFALVVHNNLAAAIATSGNALLKSVFLPGLLSGQKIGAFLLTEPQGGSDVGAIQTTAQRTHTGYRINGEKAWVSNGIHADVLSVYVQSESGMLAVIIPADTLGVLRSKPYLMSGGHALGTTGYTFHDVEVTAENLLVPEGRGMQAALAGIDIARINVAAMCCGMLESSLSYAIDFARSRQFKGQAITDMQGIQWRLADISTDLAAATALYRAAVSTFDQAGSAPVEAAQAKKFATTAALKGIADCMQIMGAPGLLQDHPVARHLVFAKIAEYLDGTTEIQNLVIARSIL